MNNIDTIELLKLRVCQTMCSFCEYQITSRHKLCPWCSISSEFCDDVINYSSDFVDRYLRSLISDLGDTNGKE